MTIIILNGGGTAGKGKFYEFCHNYIEENNGFCEKISIIDPVKVVAAAIGWRGAKTDKDRKFLADLKDLIEDYNNMPRDFIENEIWRYYALRYDYLFIDMREPEDIDWVKEISKNNFRVITVLVDREETHRDYGNSADDGVKNYSYDYVIDNNGSLKELEDAVATFMEDILFEEKLIKLVDQGAFDRN